MIYKLRFDRNEHLVFEISPEELEKKLGEDHFFLLDEPKWAGFWKTLEAEFHDDSDDQNVQSLPDITCWFTDQLVLSDKAYRALSEVLDSYGEFLPVLYKDMPYWVFHVTKLTGLDVINSDDSSRVVEASGHIDVTKMLFINSKIENQLVLKNEFDGYRNVYCSDEFKALVENAGLGGLVFSEELASGF